MNNKENKIDSTGDNNIIIQDCNLDNITVNQINIKQLTKTLSKILNRKNSALKIIILTTNLNKIKQEIDKNNITNFSVNDIQDFYGLELKDWRPFRTQNILQLLKEYQDKSGFKINAILLDSSNSEVDIDLFEEIKYEKNHTIIISDGISLHFKNNQKFASIFNDRDIGGSLFPVSTRLKRGVKSFIKKKNSEVFFSLNNYINKYSQTYLDKQTDKGFIHIDIQITNKNTFFRRLTSIATLHLHPKPERRYKDLDEIDIVPSLY